MTAPSVASSLSGLSSVIGRYFTIVSIVPSLLLVFWIMFLAGSGAWSRPPDWGRAADSLTRSSFTGVLVLFLLAVALGAVLHPMQFALVQFFEGYWGTSALAVSLRALRTAAYHRLRSDLLEMQPDEPAEGDTDEAIESRIRQDEAVRRLTYFPGRPTELMPTRLGNVLRRHELDAGSEYQLPVLVFAEHLIHVAPPEQVRYINDQRTALDFAIKSCLVGLLGSAVAVLFLWQHGMWLALAVMPYLLAYGSYRGAVVVAQHYGRALEALVGLNRFALYERLRLHPPRHIDEERAGNATLTSLTMYHTARQGLLYKHPEPGTESGKGAAGEGT